MKYIDADKLRAEIDAFYTKYKAKFHQNGDSYHLGIIDGLDMAKRILDTLPDEPVTDCHELTEAAEKYGSEYPAYNNDQFIAESAFIAGAEWQKRKMMEGAVEGEIQMRYSGLLCAKTIHAINEDKFKFGDKVRIIIAKEDEQ